MIAQEQAVVCKKGLVKSVQGTLILTTNRLIFSCGAEKIESMSKDTRNERASDKVSDETDNIALGFQGELGILSYSDVESLSSIPPDPSNIFIPISSIKSVSGHKGIVGMPRLKVKWAEGNVEKEAEFEQTITGKKRNLSEWAELILGLQSGTLHIADLPKIPPVDTLEGKVAQVMGDMQEKGIFEIEQQVEREFELDLDPDAVEQACEKLVSLGVLTRAEDSSGEAFYRKVSPIG
jgi:hypothetical protein